MGNVADPNTVSFTLTPEDYADASRLHARRYFLNSIRLKLLAAIIVVGASLAIGFSGLDSVAGSLAGGALVGLVVLVAWIVFAYFFILPRQARKIYGQQKTLQYPVEAGWSSEAYSASSAAVASTVPWLDYHGWSADDKIILLMQSPILFQMLPRRALREEQAQDFFTQVSRSGLRKL